MPTNSPRLFSVIVPVYNECNRIVAALERIESLRKPLLDSLAMDLEVVVVDDGSTDGSIDLLSNSDSIVLHSHSVNRGKGAAVRTGIKHARGEILAIQDADDEYDPMSFLELLVPILKDEADVVYGSRYQGRSRFFTHDRWVHQGLNALVYLFLGKWISDVETCQKLFRADLLHGVTLLSRSFTIEVELTIKLVRQGARLVELPIPYSRRSLNEGKKIRSKDLLKAILAIVTYGISLDSLYAARSQESRETAS